MSQESFLNSFGSVYEHSAWIAEAVYAGGLSPAEDTPEGMAAAMGRALAEAGEDRKLALIRAHPDLAGRAAIAGDLTEASRVEQAGAGLDCCTAQEYRRFQELNRAYKEKFGFPFIIAVAGKTRAEILAAFEARVENDRDTEFAAALGEINEIARLRLSALAR